MPRLFALLLLSILSFSYGCASNPVTGGSDLVLMTEEQEIAMGRKYHQELLKQYQVYQDPELQAYVSAIVEELASSSHRDQLLFHVTLLDSPQVNAFALPGGYIYITRGIMAYMNSEAELAGVLGHEIGHVTARHGVRQHTASTLTSMLAKVITSSVGTYGVSDLTNMAGTALLRGYGREHELEADRLGAEYLARSGYDPEKMIDVVAILKSQEEFDKQLAEEENREPRAYHGLFSSHPKNDQRLQEVIRAAKKYRSEDNIDRQDRFLQLTDGMVLGSNTSNGITRNNQFYHKDLGISLSFPQGWRIDNLNDRLIANSKDNDGFIQVVLNDRNKRMAPKEYLKKRFKGLRDGQEIKSASFQGYTGITSGKTPFGKRKMRVAAIYQEKKVYLIFAVAKNAMLMKQYDPAFLATIRSLNKLRTDQLHLAEPQRIKLITAKKGDTFASLAKHSSLSSHAEEQLRLLNGRYPTGEPTAGQQIKIVE